MKEIIVIKLGGSALQNAETLKELASLVRGYQKRRYGVVVVHGGGPAINKKLTEKKITWQFINGQRQTTPEMMGVIATVLGAEVNRHVVENLRAEKIAAVGVSGAQNILLCKPASEELMCVGEIENVQVQSVVDLLRQFGAKVPVIAPIGVGAKGEKYNINADWAAAQLAVALRAKKLIFLTDQVGILDQDKNLVPRLSSQKIDQMIDAGVISGGMFTKVNAMKTAVQAGIKQVRVLHASLASLILTAGTTGTLLTHGVMHGRARAS